MERDKLYELIDETVQDVIDRLGLVTEMAVPLKTYKARVDGLRFQLVENWCLCKHCQLYNQECATFPHWIKELKACINNLKFLDIKRNIDKGKTLYSMLVSDYDYNSPEMIERIVRGKLNRERIADKKERERVCSEFAVGIYDLIGAISDNEVDTDEYLSETFGYSS